MIVRTFHKSALALAVMIGLSAPAVADTLRSFTPPPDTFLQAEIRFSDGTSVKAVPISDLEALPMVEIEGHGSPNEPVTKFQGPLLRDVITAYGSDQASQITVRGLDGYAVEIPKEDWITWPVIIATRAEGVALTPRKRGPARIIYPVRLFPTLTSRAFDDRSVWLLDRIEW